MFRRLFPLFFSLLLSCGKMETGEWENFPAPEKEDYSAAMIPEQRDRLMAMMNNSHYYHLRLSVDRKNSRADCSTEIQWYNGSGSPQGELLFRLLVNNVDNEPMKIREILVDGAPAEHSLSQDHTTLTIPLERELLPGEPIDVTISYELDYTNPPVNYFDFDRIDDQGFSLAHFYPVAARFDNGIWENTPIHPGGDLLSADPSWFYTELLTDGKVTVAASGRELRQIKKGNALQSAFTAGPVRDFYICGDVDFSRGELESGDLKLISYNQKSLSRSSERAMEISASAMAVFSREFGVYPFNELKIAAMPMSALGVEFPGMFAISSKIYSDDPYYLFDPTVIHEAAHQWFYSLVGNNQLADPWIDESFAQYATWFFLKEVSGERGAEPFYNSFFSRWDRIGRNPLPIGKPVSFYKAGEYSSVIYGRAPIFMVEASRLMGEREFHNFLSHIVEKYSFRHLDTETYLAEMKQAGGQDMEELIGRYF